MNEVQIKGNPLWDSSIPPWYVYQLQDRRDNVFYVGFSQALNRRLVSHMAFSWPIAKVRYETYDTKKQALEEERRLVAKLKPEYNLQSPRHQPRENFAEIIRDLRESQGKSIRKLAKEIGVSHSHLAYIESGERRPSRTVVKALAKVLKVSVEDLLDG
jgi:DNA-binding XRE family transcriptional regulator/predicted GIY-YIG superfamily endonuclease